LHLYCANILNLHQVFANISPDNHKSIALFEKFNYQLIGIKRDWRRRNNEWIDELFYQKML
jgi:diamine N-acetyltransferase